MKKVLLGGLALLFSATLLFTACEEDDDKTCITCTADGTTYDVCWKKGNYIDMLAEVSKFTKEHADATDFDCEEPTNY